MLKCLPFTKINRAQKFRNEADTPVNERAENQPIETDTKNITGPEISFY